VSENQDLPAGLSRRHFIRALGAMGVAGVTSTHAFDALAGESAIIKEISLPFANGSRPLVKYPQKRPLIRLTARPPQLETPFEIFDEGVLTPNDAFYVRYHLTNVPPLSVDPATYRISITGKVERALKLSLNDLKTQFEPVEIVAVNQCSGNSRGFVKPRVNGGQLGNSAMGNARWRGVPLKDVLNKAGVNAQARQVAFDGLDKPLLEQTPDFVKSLDIDHALDGEVMLAYAMNGADLPMLNGYPVGLVVPGYFGTYWVKHLSEIRVVDSVYSGYWMDPAYRIPDNACACVDPGADPAHTIPINRYNVRSFITSLQDGDTVKAGEEVPFKGIAFDGGAGIKNVAVSQDGGQTWRGARLGEDLGKYSFREWRADMRLKPGLHKLKVRAVNSLGETQPMRALWNPSGYMRNVVETVRVRAS